MPHSKIAMHMKTIQIRVSEAIAKRFEAATEEERRKIEALLSLQLGELTEPERSLEEVINSMSEYAQSQGLTPDILISFLDAE